MEQMISLWSMLEAMSLRKEVKKEEMSLAWVLKEAHIQKHYKYWEVWASFPSCMYGYPSIYSRTCYVFSCNRKTMLKKRVLMFFSQHSDLLNMAFLSEFQLPCTIPILFTYVLSSKQTWECSTDPIASHGVCVIFPQMQSSLSLCQ